MKILIALLAIVGYAAAAVEIPEVFADRSLSSAVVSGIEDLRDHMPCGFPGAGVPPMAPLKIAHRNVNIDLPAVKIKGSVDHFRLNGLDDFEVADMKINAITSKVTYRFVFNNVNVDTKYDLQVLLKKYGFTVNMVGSGRAKFAIKDMHIWGVMKYSLGVVSGKLKMKSLEVRTHIGDVESEIGGILGEGTVNQKMNEVLAEAVEMAVNENEDMITETIEAMTLPKVNGVLDEYKLTDLIAIIGSDGEKTECIPKPDED